MQNVENVWLQAKQMYAEVMQGTAESSGSLLGAINVKLFEAAQSLQATWGKQPLGSSQAAPRHVDALQPIQQLQVTSTVALAMFLAGVSFKFPIYASFALALVFAFFLQVKVVGGSKQVDPLHFAGLAAVSSALLRIFWKRTRLIATFVLGFVLACAYRLLDRFYRDSRKK